MARLADVTLLRLLKAGVLVPVLTDWEALEAPAIFAAYPPSHRHSKLVHAFLDFLAEVFAELESERPLAPPYGTLPRVPKPEWFGNARGRHSAYVARSRKTPV